MDSSYKIPAAEPQMLPVGTGAEARNIAFIARSSGPTGVPGLFWLSGFMSDMASTKATAVAEWAAAHGLSSTRFDYSGHGISGRASTMEQSGDGSKRPTRSSPTSREVRRLLSARAWEAILRFCFCRSFCEIVRPRLQRIKALLLIAPAWDMTEELMWKRFSDRYSQRYFREGLFQTTLRVRGAIYHHAQADRRGPRPSSRASSHSIPRGPSLSCRGFRTSMCPLLTRMNL